MRSPFLIAVAASFLCRPSFGAPTIPACGPVQFEYLTDSMNVDSTTGIIVSPINREVSAFDFSLWDLSSAKLLDTVMLSHRRSNMNVVGFADSNTVLTLSREFNDLSGPSLVAYKIKEKTESALWDDSDQYFLLTDFSVPGNIAFAGMGATGPFGPWKTVNLATGSLTDLADKSAPTSERGAFSADGKAYFSANTILQDQDWKSFHIDITRWSAATFKSPAPAASLTPSDFGISKNLDAYQNSVKSLVAGPLGHSLYVSSNIEFADHAEQNYITFIDLGTGAKFTCPVQEKGRADIEIVDDQSHTLLVSDSMAGNYHPVLMDAKTCKTTALPSMKEFSDLQYPPKLRAAKVKGRSILFNYQRVWDASTGKLLLKMCQ